MTKKFLGFTLIIIIAHFGAIVVRNAMASGMQSGTEDFQFLFTSIFIGYASAILIPILYILFLRGIDEIKTFSTGLIIYHSFVQLPFLLLYFLAQTNGAVVNQTFWIVFVIASNVIGVIAIGLYLINLIVNRPVEQPLLTIFIVYIIGVIFQNPVPPFLINSSTVLGYYFVYVSGFSFVVLSSRIMIAYIHEKVVNYEA